MKPTSALYPAQCRISRVKRTAPIPRRPNRSAILLVLLAMASPAFAQTIATPAPAPPQPEFEAVSIHMVDAHTADDLAHGRGIWSMSPFPTSLFTIRNLQLRFIVQLAYKTDGQDYISGMPGWMETQEYDISAKVEGDRQLTLEEIRPMLQRLLEQRLHFAAHHETKVISGFALVVARGGPKLQPSKDDRKPSWELGSHSVNVWHLDTEQIATMLGRQAGQPVVDKTGLAGTYDFKLSYAAASDANSSGPDFFTALQEQLGLKLEPQRVPVDFLVIDHVDKTPTEN
jgi:uncharacterized protein (TIGR03435 family)